FAAIGFCPLMQLPGPTLIVTEGTSFTVTLTNSLPAPAGNTSIIFPGLVTTSSNCGAAGSGTAQGLLTCEATNGGSVTYTVQIPVGSAGTHIYQSGTQPDLQIEMGLFGAVVVLPATPPANCTAIEPGREDYRLAPAAYDHPLTCYDREYLFQWSEIDPRIHAQALAQVNAAGNCTAGAAGCRLDVAMEPYHPNYYLINGRSMPDDMDANYAPNYPNQPYNGNPHMHPGELTLLRVTGQGHWQHPFHEHANHVRILARDAHLLLAQANDTTTYGLLAGRMEFNTDTTPGQALDGIFYWSGKGLGWDIFGHTPANGAANPPCVPDVNGYYTTLSGATPPSYTGNTMTGGSPNYYEWCADHDVPLEANPVSTNVAGTVGAGGPITLMDPLVLTNGLWYNGTPYLGPDAVNRSRGPTPLPPGAATQNPPAESGIAFMWHSHNEREITTNDVFPGGMLMIMLVDPYVWNIDETL
ncbi:MAG: multicopper oxidase domain-containing protein, partial [Steroidobacteraceae bacterium]